MVTQVSADNKTNINFGKANWDAYTVTTDTLQPTSTYAGEKMFKNTLKDGRKRFVCQQVEFPEFKHFQTKAVLLADESDKLRQANPADPQIRELKSKFLHCSPKLAKQSGNNI